ncbi:MAG: NADPH-dependent 7-cyano-7-deazaguanine reductase QueF [Pseudohongiellaceae bacterium]
MVTTNPLGQQVAVPRFYDPGQLLPIPRAENRAMLGIGIDLPFTGADVWNAFELSWLDPQGLPQVARGRFIFPCTSPNIIESKSLKLYLNSLNQHRFADRDAAIATIEADLTQAAGAPVQVMVQPFKGMQELLETPDGTCLDTLEAGCEHYEVEPALLRPALASNALGAAEVEEVLYTDLFRSLCPVTGQPDWASVVICYHGAPIEHAALLRYLVSFREHRDYHENCVERIYCDLLQRCQPRSLSVEANFLRRGGLDINPVRASSDSINYVLLPRYNRQ